MITHKKIRQLLQYDELYLGVKKGFIFEGFVEPPLRFLPTYKFAPDTDLYDAVKRKPAWTDRVLVHCLGGEVDVEEKFDTKRTEMYLVSSNTTNHHHHHQNNRRENNNNNNGDDDEEESEVATMGFLEVDDARGGVPLMARQGSGSDIGSDGAHSNKSTPPISPSAGPNHNNNRQKITNASMFSNNSTFSGTTSSTAGTTPQAFANNNQNNNGDLSPLCLSPSTTTAVIGKNTSIDPTTHHQHQNNLFPSNVTSPQGLTMLRSNSSNLSEAGYYQFNNNMSNNENDDDNENTNNQNSNQQQQQALPRASASFEDFLAEMDRARNNLNATIENRMSVNWYCSVPSLRMSDHRPVASAFDINVAYLSKEQQEILEFDTKQEIGLDFLDELKYAL